MERRKYKNYAGYTAHQIKKTADPKLKKRLDNRRAPRINDFVAEFTRIKDLIPKDTKALCLGARYGEEVEALQNLGYDAIGIDLVPHEPLVIKGDFHNIPFDDSSFDLVYSNSTDHIYDLDKFAAETKRVLKENGFVYVRLAPPDSYGSFESIKISIPEFIQRFPEFAILYKWTNKKEGLSLRTGLLLHNHSG